MKKKIIITIIFLILVAAIIMLLVFWDMHNKKINYCKQMCSYENEIGDWQCCGKSNTLINIYGDRYFPNQEQCIDYCLIRDAEYRKNPEWFK